MNGIYFLIGCGILVTLAVVIWYVKFANKKVFDIPPTAPCVVNLNPHLMNGHITGFELNCIPGENGERIVEVIPNDYLPNSEGKTRDEIKAHTFLLGKGKRMSIGTGHLGNQKEVVVYLPATFRKLDSKIAESDFGRFIIKGLQHQEFENQTYHYFKKIEKSMERLIMSRPDRAIALANAEIKDIIQEAISSLQVRKEEEKKSPFGRNVDRGF